MSKFIPPIRSLDDFRIRAYLGLPTPFASKAWQKEWRR
jgi:hypothetical protein